MRTVGELLQKNREKKNFTLEDISQLTKISLDYLKAIEKSDYNSLPAPVFTKGFIRSYAQILGLDASDVLAFYRREYDERKAKEKFSIKPPQPLRREIQVFTPSVLIFSVIFILVAGFIFYLYFQYRSYSKTPDLTLEQPEDRKQQTISYTEVSGKAGEDAVVKINGQTIKTLPDGSFSITVDLVEGENRIEVTATNPLGKESVEKRTVYFTREKSEEEVKEEENRGDSIVLEIIVGPSSAWIKVEKDGEGEFEGILIAGTSRIFTAKDEIKVRTGNGGSTKVIVDGIDKGLMGQEGIPVEKIFRKE